MSRIPHTYRFHAEGHALGGEVHLPIWCPIDAQAATSLPTVGGQASALAQNFFHHDFVSFRSAHTHVSGRTLDHETYLTHATTTIEGLNIRGILTADRIVGRLTSTRKRSLPESEIVAADSRFEGLRIAGYDVKVVLRHDLLVRCKTFAALKEEVTRDKNEERIATITDKVAICSLVDKIETRLPGVHPRQHEFEVENFGKISVAEIYAEPGTRALTMLRLEMGSDVTANLTVAETRTNGQPIPPPTY